MNKKIKNIHVVIIIIIGAMLGLIPFMFPGIAKGDDGIFHLTQIQDIIYGYKNGFGFQRVGHLIAGGLGYNAHIFYSPLSHYSVAAVYLLIEPLGVDLIFAVKLTIFIVFIITGFTAYLLSYDIFKNKLLALVSGLLYIWFPYHLINVFYRFALAELFAYTFIPLFFLGLRRIINESKARVSSYLYIVISTILIIVSHNLTALYIALFGVLYLLLHFKKTLSLFKSPIKIIFSVLSIILIISSSLFYIIPLLENMQGGQYIVSVGEMMHQVSMYLAGTVRDSIKYLGFALLGKKLYFDPVSFIYMFALLITFIGAIVLFITIDKHLTKVNNYIKSILMVLISVICMVLFDYNYALLIGLLFFIIVFNFVKLHNCDYKITKENLLNTIKDIINDKEARSYLIIAIVIFTLMVNPLVWFIVPSFMTKIQFAWRLNGYLVLPIVILVPYLYVKARNKKVASLSIIVFMAYILGCNTVFPSEFKAFREYEKYSDQSWLTVEYEYYHRYIFSGGWQKEYTPIEFFDEFGYSYESKYDNSLYDECKTIYDNDWVNEDIVVPNPVFLTGSGNITVTNRSIPNYDLQVNVNEKGIIQIPLYFYKGYVVEVDGKTLPTTNIDGLVSFEIESGTYDLKLRYAGTKASNLSNIISTTSICAVTLITGISVVCYIIKNKNRKEELPC